MLVFFFYKFIKIFLMKRSVVLAFFLAISFTVAAQDGFHFENPNRKKTVIPFQLINNLIFIPIIVNGIELTFLLDTGVDETILFSLDDKEDVSFQFVEKIKLKGLGKENSIDGLKSSQNQLTSHGLTDTGHDIYIVLDQNFNFSSSIGIPVNGIIGYHFFKNHLVEINYQKKKIIVYNETQKARRRIAGKYKKFAISIESNKPYMISTLTLADKPMPAKLLIDSGSSDALWLFESRSEAIKIPSRHFNDFLGRGFSGEIQGKRARITRFDFAAFAFTNTIAAFPDSIATQDLVMVEDRLGSVGGEILKRFDMVFDYREKQMFLRKNSNFDEPFHYNMSGIEIHHSGMTWVPETVGLKPVAQENTFDINGNKIPSSFIYKFELKPIYAISNIRKDSPADLCGLKKDDIILSINNKLGYRYSLQDVNSLLKSEEGKSISMEVERNGVKMNFEFQLKSIL